MKKSPKKQMILLKGESISPGVAIGKAYVHEDFSLKRIPMTKVSWDETPAEKERLSKALEESKKETAELIERTKIEFGPEEGGIFMVHMAIMNDKGFSGLMLKRVEQDLLKAESAVKSVVLEWEKRLIESANLSLSMKSADVIDIGRRILTNLCIDCTMCYAQKGLAMEDIGRNVIFITRMLLPSIGAVIDKHKIKGLAAQLGNKASHSAVLAKTLGIPTVFGVSSLINSVRTGSEIIIDGTTGNIYIHPDKHIKNEFETFKRKYSTYKKSLEKLIPLPSVTKDGREIGLYANIGASADAETAMKNNVKGVGLYRTEMPFIIRNEYPEEELQYSIYSRVIKRMEGRPVSIRTLDLGGDKILSYLPIPKEENPHLGWRAIRVFIDYPELFKKQLRAILRASTLGPVKIIIPMISDLDEIRITRRILNEVKRELRRKKVLFDPDIQLGIMIEVPSAAILARRFIKEVDFFSVGTNDLVQYTLAVDRNSEKVSKYFEPLNPAILMLLKDLVTVTEEAGKEISLCGEAASDPLYIPLLVGLGFTQLSVNPQTVNTAKDIIRSIFYKDAKALAAKALKKDSAGQIRTLLKDFFTSIEKLYPIYFH